MSVFDWFCVRRRERSLSPIWCMFMTKAFNTSENGNVAVIFALALVPIMAMLGAAVDYSAASTAKLNLQNAVDVAVLAAAKEPDTTKRNALGQAFMASNLRQSAVVSSFVTNADGTVTGTASWNFPTSFSGFVGMSSIALGAKVTVDGIAQPPSELYFKAISAQGWYWKKIDLIVQNAGTTTETTLASYVYQMTSKNTSGGTLVASYNDGTGAMVAGPLDKTITLQKNYQNLYLKMTVYEDGCGPGYVVAHDSTDSNFKCAVAGSAYVSNGYTKYEKSKSSGPVIYTTNPKDPASAASSHNLFVQDMTGKVTPNGKTIKTITVNVGGVAKTVTMVMMPNNTKPSIFDILPCPSPADGLVEQWEDTSWNGSGDPPGSWSIQDFTFSVKSQTCAENVNYDGSGAVTANGVASSANRKIYLRD